MAHNFKICHQFCPYIMFFVPILTSEYSFCPLNNVLNHNFSFKFSVSIPNFLFPGHKLKDKCISKITIGYLKVQGLN